MAGLKRLVAKKLMQASTSTSSKEADDPIELFESGTRDPENDGDKEGTDPQDGTDEKNDTLGHENDKFLYYSDQPAAARGVVDVDDTTVKHDFFMQLRLNQLRVCIIVGKPRVPKPEVNSNSSKKQV